MPNQIPLFNTDPNVQAQAALLQQRQALAQALMGQGMQPLDTQNRTVGGVGYHVSPFEGLAKMVQAYAGQKMLQDSVQQQAGLAAQAYANLLRQNQPQEQPSYSPDQVSGAAQSALASGAQTGDQAPQYNADTGSFTPAQKNVGPTLANALRMGDTITSQKPANPGSPANPYNPLNAPAELLAGYQAGYIPKEMFDSQMAMYKPTEATIQAHQGNMDPVAANQQAFAKTVTDGEVLRLQQAGFTPQQIHDYMAAKNAKDTYIAPIDVKADSLLFDPTGKKPLAYVPKTADGMALAFGRDANGTLVPSSSYAIPGYAGGNAGIKGAEAYAVQSAPVITVTSPDGRSVPVRAGAAANVGGAQLGIGGGGAGGPAAPSGAPPATQMPRAPMGQPAPQATRPMIGQSTTDAATQKGAADVLQNAPQLLQQSRSAITGLEAALQALQGVRATGPGTLRTNDVLAALNNIPGVSVQGDGVNNYQALSKYLANSLNQAAQGTGAGGSDARFESFMHGQPNADTMNKPALEGAIRYVLSQHDANVARSQFLQNAYQRAQQAGDPNAALTAQQQWASAYRPEYFAFNRMSPEDQAKFLKSQGKNAAQWVQGYNAYGQQTGWVH